MNKSHVLSVLLFFCLLPLSSLLSADYYWIGGSGNWSDLNNWATTSGGGLTHAQAPTANDNVFFDANSFTGPNQVVTMNTTIAFCRTMDWTGATNNPRLLGGDDVRLSVFGGMELIANMDFAFTGEIVFGGNDPGNTVNFGPHTAGENVTFSGAGDWQLTGPLTIDSVLYLLEGRLNTNDQPINCQYFNSQETGNRTLELTGSTVTIGGSNIEAYFQSPTEFNFQALRLNATNLSVDPGTSTINFTNPNAVIAVQGPGAVNLNQVILSSTNGLSFILPFAQFGELNNYPDITFAELDLRHDTQIQGGMDIGDLLLAADKRYVFESSFTYTVGDIQAVGDCQMGIVLEATDAGNTATLSTANNVSVDFVSLQGIRAAGGGTLTANNAIDLGNNPGWVLNERPSQDLYWVGGNGDWDDPTHWSFTSGGPGSGCIPSFVDNVFFDGNSFNGAGQTVDLNVPNAYCRSMDWTGATGTPVFAGLNSNNMRISGSLNFIGAMDHTFEGSYFFNSNLTGNTITTAGQPFRLDLNFAGDGGEWILQDSVFVEWGVYFESGILNTNDQFLECNWFYSLPPVARELYLGSSHILTNWREFRSAIWEINTTNLVIDASNSTIESAGAYSSLFNTYGTNTVAYNNLIFSAPEVRYFSYTDNPTFTDSLFYINDGFIGTYQQSINYLLLSPGNTYRFQVGDINNINILDANGSCDEGLVYIQSGNAGQRTIFRVAQDQDLSRVYVQDVHEEGTGTVNLMASLDGGNSTGWNITGGGGRDLYWVGDNGLWHDTNNWSLTSGGPGGECIPTPVDNVFFDENSFVTDGANVEFFFGTDAYCRDYTVTPGLAGNVFFHGVFLNVFGSMSLESPITWYIQWIRFRGEGNHTIRTTDNVINGIVFEADGDFDLLDPLTANYSVEMLRGRFASNGNLIDTDGFFAVGDLPSEFDLGDGRIICRRSDVGLFGAAFGVFSGGFQMAPSDHTIELSGADTRLQLYQPITINNLEFTDPQGQGEIQGEFEPLALTANRIDFSGNGEVIGNNVMDSLFFAPGKSYTFEADHTQTINDYWETIGNNCTSIELSSSILGVKAMASMPANGEVRANFVQMRDIAASGGADFLAGAFSTDIANSNTGWVFESRPDLVEVGFLGPDRALCSGEPVVLDAFSFSVGEMYRWSDNTTNPTITVDVPGVYFAEVTFLDNCVLTDTVEVIAGQDFAVDIQDNPELCAGDELVLDAGLNLVGASYEWQDGSILPTFTATGPGEYSVSVNLGGCIEADTTIVTENFYPALDLGADLTRCPEQDFTLDANVSADTYLWQDGSTNASFTGDMAGTYFLSAANGSCAITDTVIVVYVDPGAFELGNDTTLCDQDQFQLMASLPGATFEWQDGTTSADFSATASGQYFVEATVSGCTVSDTINLDFFATPDLMVDNEYSGCAGEPITIMAVNGADGYNWSDGDNDAEFSTLLAGDYSLVATFGVCEATTDFSVVFNEFPVVTSPGMDSTLCEGDSWTLLAATDIGSIQWQDGSTNPSLTVTDAGDYFFVADNAGCTTTSNTITVDILDLPDLDVAGDYTACAGTTFTLSTAVSADSYEWSNGDTGTSFSSDTPGSYTLTVNLDHCSVTDDFSWMVVNPPTVDLGQDQRICADAPLTLQAGQTGTWQDGTMAANYTVTNSGLYVVTVGDVGCSTTDSVAIEVVPLPAFSLGEDQAACAGETITITGPTNLGTLSWEDGSTQPTRTLVNSGLYILTIEDADGCQGRDSVNVDFADLPLLELGPDTVACDNAPYVIRPILGEGDLRWSDGSTGDDLFVSIPSVITAELDNNGCISRDTVSVRFRECVFFQAYLPNAFSPDLDGNNDEFRPFFDSRLEIIEYEMQVFARWGDRMFVSTSPDIGWQGDFRGEMMEKGVYVYFIKMTYRDDRGVDTKTLSGDVTLLR